MNNATNTGADNTSLFLNPAGNVVCKPGLITPGMDGRVCASRNDLIDYLVEHGVAAGPHFHEYTSTYHAAVADRLGGQAEHGKAVV